MSNTSRDKLPQNLIWIMDICSESWTMCKLQIKMNEPICIAQVFVNKQNVRSFSNILNLKLLNSDNEQLFLQEIFRYEHLVRNTPASLRKIIFELQKNITYYCNRDFKDYFIVFKNVYRNISAVEKENIYCGCWLGLSKIIPKTFFGCNHNVGVFKKCIKTIIYSMNRQYLDFEKLIKKWDFKIYPWNDIPATQAFEVLYSICLWITKILLSSMITLNFYVTTCKIDNDENLLYFFWKSQWQSFYDSKISEMTIAKVIHKSDIYCLGKKLRLKYSLQEKLKLKLLKKDIPKLHLVLKPNNEYRPIVRYKTETPNGREKQIMKERLYFLRKLTGKPHEKIETQFTSVYFLWLKRRKPKLYFIKTDLSNAFGSINKTKLLKVIHEKQLELQNTESSMCLKKKHSEHYKEMMAELKKPLLIRTGSTVYEWMQGLVQGYKYSPALSELYYTYMDEIYFKEHLKNNNDLKLFIRVVDDYLYITDSLEDAHLFLKALANYKNVNYAKTVVNFEHPYIKFSNKITFLGHTYFTDNFQVGRANSVYTGQMCYKISFSASIINLEKFLENRIGQSGIQINSHIFNLYYNSEELIWQHIFVTLCLSANKFCTILSILCDDKDKLKYLTIYKDRVSVRLCNTIIESLKKNKPHDIEFIFCINHFRYLSFKALLLCARNTFKCNILVPYINIELAKCNCMYGKWKDHARLISKCGKVKVKAIRDVCRKSDLRQIFRNFDKLPYGFQCYDHRKFFNHSK